MPRNEVNWAVREENGRGDGYGRRHNGRPVNAALLYHI
jgi:hypothetical protein